MRLRGLLAVLLTPAALVAVASADSVTGSPPAHSARTTLRRTARPVPATTPSHKVWTARDLTSLRETSPGTINYIETPSTSIPTEPQAPAPLGVPQRYAELVAQADQALEKLSREKLAAVNPYLRGLAGAGGPRSTSEIERDIEKWQDRKQMAAAGLQRAQAPGAATSDGDQ